MNGALLSLVPTLSLRETEGALTSPRPSGPSVVLNALARFCLGISAGLARLFGGVTARCAVPGTYTSLAELVSTRFRFSSTGTDLDGFSGKERPIRRAAAFDKRGCMLGEPRADMDLIPLEAEPVWAFADGGREYVSSWLGLHIGEEYAGIDCLSGVLGCI